MNFWDDRYGAAEFVYGTAPNDFLVEQALRIPPGPVLCLAEGEGRNAVHLAKLGYDVTAVDGSKVGLKKAQSLAASAGRQIKTVASDLSEYQIAPSSWSGIVSIFAHFEPKLRKAVHSAVVSGLRPGGVFILEAYTPNQLKTEGVGGPTGEQANRLMALEDLRSELVGLQLVIAKELEREVNEGSFHRGRGAVVQIVAIKAI